jgi:hypothetical protein
MNRTELAVSHFNQGYSCSQSVCAADAGTLLDELLELAPKPST